MTPRKMTLGNAMRSQGRETGQGRSRRPQSSPTSLPHGSLCYTEPRMGPVLRAGDAASVRCVPRARRHAVEAGSPEILWIRVRNHERRELCGRTLRGSVPLHLAFCASRHWEPGGIYARRDHYALDRLALFVFRRWPPATSISLPLSVHAGF